MHILFLLYAHLIHYCSQISKLEDVNITKQLSTILAKMSQLFENA